MKTCKIKLPKERGFFLQICIFSLFYFFIAITIACSDGSRQNPESCSNATGHVPGLYCGSCTKSKPFCWPGLYCGSCTKSKPFCVRGQATIPTSDIGGLRFNNYTWLVTHNAFSNLHAPLLTGPRMTFYNQEDNVTNQLRNGVRGLMLDMYDFRKDIWLCHSAFGECYNFTAFEPAINTLREVEAFLNANPREIVTIIIEDYVHSPKGLTKLFKNARLYKYLYPVKKMPKKGGVWPTINSMVKKNHRLLVFTSNSTKEASEGIAYQWGHMVENQSGDPGVKVPSLCPNRKESKPLNSKGSLFLMNYFPTYPKKDKACKEHSAGLAKMVSTCYQSAGNMMPTFLAVNFYMRSNGGGVFDELDRMNGHRGV